MLLVFFAGLTATYIVYKTMPTGFVPDEDQGYFIIAVQAPQGASVEYASNAVREVEAIASTEKDILGAFSVIGFSFTGNGPNKAMIFLTLKSINDRVGDRALGQRHPQPTARASDGSERRPAFPFSPLPLRVSAVWVTLLSKYRMRSRRRCRTSTMSPRNWPATATRGPAVRPASSVPSPPTTRNSWSTSTVIKRAACKCPSSRCADALQVYIGSAYVNDFDFNNRTYRVYVQAAQPFRRQPRDIHNLYVRSDAGVMIPLDNVVNISEGTSPQVITHYNIFRSAESMAPPLPGSSSARPSPRWTRSPETCPSGSTIRGAGLSLEESARAAVGHVVALGLLLVYLDALRAIQASSCPSSLCSACPMAMLDALIAQIPARPVE